MIPLRMTMKTPGFNKIFSKRAFLALFLYLMCYQTINTMKGQYNQTDSHDLMKNKADHSASPCTYYMKPLHQQYSFSHSGVQNSGKSNKQSSPYTTKH